MTICRRMASVNCIANSCYDGSRTNSSQGGRMQRYVLTGAIVAVMTAGAAAQKTSTVHPGKGGSPHVRTEWTVDGAAVSIEYGRPFLKGRTISAIAPNGQVW